MRMLIIGGGGMAGSMMADYFLRKQGIEVLWTTRDGSGSSLPLDAANLYAVRGP